MPAPDLKPQVPGETADTSNSAPQAPSLPTPSTPADERQAMLLTLSKQTVAVITEALPALTGSDLFSLRDLEAAGSGRKGVFEALEVEDKRREAVANDDAEPTSAPLPAELCVVVAGALFDFLGFLTTRDKVIALGATEEAGAAVEAVSEWAATRGLSLDEAAVGGWRELGVELTEASVAPPQTSAEPSNPSVNSVQAAGQAVLTDQGWVVPEPPKKG